MEKHFLDFYCKEGRCAISTRLANLHNFSDVCPASRIRNRAYGGLVGRLLLSPPLRADFIDL
jgi:hypothetical protein